MTAPQPYPISLQYVTIKKPQIFPFDQGSLQGSNAVKEDSQYFMVFQLPYKSLLGSYGRAHFSLIPANGAAEGAIGWDRDPAATAHAYIKETTF